MTQYNRHRSNTDYSELDSEELYEMMDDCASSKDTEWAHRRADTLLVNMVRKLSEECNGGNHDEIESFLETYRTVNKWYC